MTDLDDPDVNHERAVTRPHHHVPVYASTHYPRFAVYLAPDVYRHPGGAA